MCCSAVMRTPCRCQQRQPDFRLRTERNVEEGETLFEILHDGLLTPAAAYNDKEVGLEFKSWAQRIGPGFGTVALASYVAIDRVRGFRAGQWFAGSQDICGSNAGYNVHVGDIQ